MVVWVLNLAGYQWPGYEQWLGEAKVLNPLGGFYCKNTNVKSQPLKKGGYCGEGCVLRVCRKVVKAAFDVAETFWLLIM